MFYAQVEYINILNVIFEMQDSPDIARMRTLLFVRRPVARRGHMGVRDALELRSPSKNSANGSPEDSPRPLAADCWASDKQDMI